MEGLAAHTRRSGVGCLGDCDAHGLGGSLSAKCRRRSRLAAQHHQTAALEGGGQVIEDVFEGSQHLRRVEVKLQEMEKGNWLVGTPENTGRERKKLCKKT